MPELGPLHPIIVHFVIGFLVAGVIFRLLSLGGKRLSFAGPAAAALLLAGAGASIVAVESGEEAHEIPERIPGVREAIGEHEEWGERTRNLFLLVGALELAALGLRRSRHRGKLVAASAVVGVVGLAFLYETGEHGGELVYSYAAGVGTRTGEDGDVQRLLVAGLYHQSARERQAGRGAEAARWVDELVRLRPSDPGVRLLEIRSLLEDRNDGRAALEAIATLPVPDSDRRLRLLRGIYAADAYESLGIPDSARAVLRRLQGAFPDDRRIEERLERLGG
ncbi:MAG: DUF2231 domain-containing protein [Gemmatimonadota bacterium]